MDDPAAHSRHPKGWFDAPLFIVTSTHIKVHRRILDDPIIDNPAELGRVLRGLVAEGRAKARGTRRYINPTVWHPILAAYGYRCAYCGASDVPLEKDHRTPVSKGGTDDPANLVPACKPCNVRKHNHAPEDWPLLIEPVG